MLDRFHPLGNRLPVGLRNTPVRPEIEHGLLPEFRALALILDQSIGVVQQFPITFKLSGPAPNLGVRHGSVVAGARWGHSNTIQAAAWLVKLR